MPCQPRFNLTEGMLANSTLCAIVV